MKNRKMNLEKVIKSYFEQYDDYFEAKDAFIADVNVILQKDEDRGIICKNVVDEHILHLKEALEVEA